MVASLIDDSCVESEIILEVHEVEVPVMPRRVPREGEGSRERKRERGERERGTTLDTERTCNKESERLIKT